MSILRACTGGELVLGLGGQKILNLGATGRRNLRLRLGILDEFQLSVSMSEELETKLKAISHLIL